MKIGIITLHNNRNKGSLLQNYSLLHTIKELRKNVKIETIDYRCFSHEFKRYKNSLLTKQLNAVPARIRDFRQSKQFLQEHCSLSSRKFISDNYNKSVSFLNKQEYDVLLFGSDTIWKVTQGYNHRFSGQRPFPNIYFGGTQVSAPKIAYAASANKTNLDIFEEAERKFLTDSLGNFHSIGVRDTHTENMLLRMGIETFSRVPDPTFLYDIPMPTVTGEKYKTIMDNKEPILGINTPRHPFISELVGQFRQVGYQIVSPNASPYSDVDFVGDLSPFEYYRLHNEFDFMITSSLHSTIFCLQHATPFVTIDLNESYKNLPSKTESLLGEFDLLDRHVEGFAEDYDNFELENHTKLHSSEKEQIDTVLREHRKTGRNFLERALSEIETVQ